MRIFGIWSPLAVLLLFGLNGNAQLTSAIVGSPQYCRNEIGQIEIRYQVLNKYTNTNASSVIIRLGSSRVLSFFLFTGRDHTEAASAVYQSNEDAVETPRFRRRRLKPEESVNWSTVAIIMIDGQESSSRLPKPGDYFLLPFPDISVGDHTVDTDKGSGSERMLPIKITRPESDPPLCNRRK